MKQSFVKYFDWLWQNGEKILIILFLATFSFNLRKVFLTEYSFLNGQFNEYLTVSFGWADLLMLGTIMIYATKYLFSQYRKPGTDNSLLHIVIRNKSSVIRIYYSVSRETFVLLIFLVWVGLSILWSPLKPVAVYRAVTLAEFAIFLCIAYKILTNNKKWLNYGLLALIFGGMFQSAVGIAQFITNKSLGLRILGESILGPNLPGVAKIILSGEKHIRAYGTFPHPNLLAGFLIVPVILILAVFLEKLSSFREGLKNVSHGTLASVISSKVAAVSFIVLSAGFALTFSRSAFFGLVAGLLILIFFQTRKITARLRLVLFLVVLLIGLGFGYAVFQQKNLISLFSTQSLEERVLYQNVARETVLKHPLAGVGAGQFVFVEYKEHLNFAGWQFQPVHNLYLLVTSELGISGLVLLLIFLLAFLERGIGKNFHAGDNLTMMSYYCIIVSFLVIAFFDHYFWDIKTGLIIFSIPLMLLAVGESQNAD